MVPELLRTFLPERLPLGWSPYINAEEAPDAWIVRDDEVGIIVMLCRTPDDTIKLGVTIFARALEPLDEARCARVLEHFRNVREFVQTEMPEPHTRMFLGQLAEERRTPPELVN
jgi:hypothetical protein